MKHIKIKNNSKKSLPYCGQFGLVLICTVLLYLPSQAQFSIHASIGPGWGIMGSEFKPRTCRIVYYNDYQTKKTTYADTNFSCGGGLHIKLTGAYIFKKNPWLGVQLAAGYTTGKDLTAKGGLLMNASWNSAYYIHYNTTYCLRGRMIWLEPAVRFALPGKKWSPYLTAGPVLAYHLLDETTNLSCVVSLSGYRPYQRVISEFKYQSGLSAGAAVNAGLAYNTGWGLGVFVECAATFNSYTPKSAEFVKYELDGEDKLNEMTTCNKQFEFTDANHPAYYDKDGEFVSLVLIEPDYVGNPAQDPDKPSESRKFSFSFSNIAVVAGLSYTFGE